VDFAVGILSAVLTSVTFMGVLWSVAAAWTSGLGGTHFSFPAIWSSRW
jgi:putative ATP-binding cassette transporter